MDPDDTKNSKLGSMPMPPAPAGQGPAAPTGAYTDPDTGATSDKEPGLEEGDLVMDYAMPLRSLFTGGIAAAGKMVLNAAAKKATGSLLQNMRENVPPASEEPPTLNYSTMGQPGPGSSGKVLQYRQGGYNGQQGPGNTTDATTGMDLPAPRGR